MTSQQPNKTDFLGMEPLQIITVVKDDLSGLKRTENSLHNFAPNEIWSIVTPFDESETHKYSLGLFEDGIIRNLIPDAGLGVYAAMNAAIASHSLDSWLWFINSGDEIGSGEAVDLIKQRVLSRDHRWFYGGYHLASESGQILGEKLAPQNFKIENQLFSKHYVSHQALIVSNSLLTKIDGFDTNLKISADWDLFVRLSNIEDPGRIDFPLSVFHMGGISTQARVLGNRELLSLRKKYLPKKFLLKSYYWFIFRTIRNQLVRMLENYLPQVADKLRKLRFKISRVVKNRTF